MKVFLEKSLLNPIGLAASMLAGSFAFATGTALAYSQNLIPYQIVSGPTPTGSAQCITVTNLNSAPTLAACDDNNESQKFYTVDKIGEQMDTAAAASSSGHIVWAKNFTNISTASFLQIFDDWSLIVSDPGGEGASYSTLLDYERQYGAWTWAMSEGYPFTVNLVPQVVTYGWADPLGGSTYTHKTVQQTGSYTCNNATFGPDPAPGHGKGCYTTFPMLRIHFSSKYASNSHCLWGRTGSSPSVGIVPARPDSCRVLSSSQWSLRRTTQPPPVGPVPDDPDHARWRITQGTSCLTIWPGGQAGMAPCGAEDIKQIFYLLDPFHSDGAGFKDNLGLFGQALISQKRLYPGQDFSVLEPGPVGYGIYTFAYPGPYTGSWDGFTAYMFDQGGGGRVTITYTGPLLCMTNVSAAIRDGRCGAYDNQVWTLERFD